LLASPCPRPRRSAGRLDDPPCPAHRRGRCRLALSARGRSLLPVVQSARFLRRARYLRRHRGLARDRTSGTVSPPLLGNHTHSPGRRVDGRSVAQGPHPLQPLVLYAPTPLRLAPHASPPHPRGPPRSAPLDSDTPHRPVRFGWRPAGSPLPRRLLRPRLLVVLLPALCRVEFRLCSRRRVPAFQTSPLAVGFTRGWRLVAGRVRLHPHRSLRDAGRIRFQNPGQVAGLLVTLSPVLIRPSGGHAGRTIGRRSVPWHRVAEEFGLHLRGLTLTLGLPTPHARDFSAHDGDRAEE